MNQQNNFKNCERDLDIYGSNTCWSGSHGNLQWWPVLIDSTLHRVHTKGATSYFKINFVTVTRILIIIFIHATANN